MSDTPSAVGFVGLGNMGSVLAANLVDTGAIVVCHDSVGPARAPAGAEYVGSVAEVSSKSQVVVLSLPDGAASNQVADQLLVTPTRRVTHVVDTSTVGVTVSEGLAATFAASDVAYVDAAVSGGVAGARARTLAIMYAGSATACEAVEPVLAGLSDRRFRVGDRPGMAQAMKLANNFLSATALVATSEAVAFGLACGLDPTTMIEVLDASSGRNTATADKFPNHVLTGTYASGFSNLLMAKDVELYLDAVASQQGPHRIGDVAGAVWREFADAEADVDFTRIFPFVAGEDLPR